MFTFVLIVTAVAGLALGSTSNVAHYLPFLRPLSEHGDLASGLATSLPPAIGATLFTAIALNIIKCKLPDNIHILCRAH